MIDLSNYERARPRKEHPAMTTRPATADSAPALNTLPGSAQRRRGHSPTDIHSGGTNRRADKEDVQ